VCVCVWVCVCECVCVYQRVCVTETDFMGLCVCFVYFVRASCESTASHFHVQEITAERSDELDFNQTNAARHKHTDGEIQMCRSTSPEEELPTREGNNSGELPDSCINVKCHCSLTIPLHCYHHHTDDMFMLHISHIIYIYNIPVIVIYIYICIYKYIYIYIIVSCIHLYTNIYILYIIVSCIYIYIIHIYIC